jgi:superfamily II DNA or RNA helicase
LTKKAKLIIRDEVNVKFEGLEIHDRRKLVNLFKYEKPGARFIPSVRLGRWDGKIPFFQLGGSTFINMLPEVLPELEHYNIEVDDRRNHYDFNFEPVDQNSFSNYKWEDNSSIILRDYQVTIINSFLSNLQSVQEIATGAGKTLVTAALSQRCEKYGRSLVIVPSKSLVIQTEEEYQKLGLDVGVYFGQQKDTDKTHTICTWQSLNSLLKKSTEDPSFSPSFDEFISGVVCLMVDETHSAKADILKNLLTQPLANIPIRWGLTGTIPKEKLEWKSILVGLGDVVNKISASHLQDIGVLANCHVNVQQLVDHGEYSNYQQELKYLTTNQERINHIGFMMGQISETGNTLILVDRISTGEMLHAYLVSIYNNDDVIFIKGATGVDERKEHYDEIKSSTNKTIIATYGVAAVGINVPRIFNLVLIEPGKSFVRVIQSIGRGIRKSHDKDFVQIWDITSTCKFSKRHLTKRKAFYKEANYDFKVTKINWDE